MQFLFIEDLIKNSVMFLIKDDGESRGEFRLGMNDIIIYVKTHV